MTPVSLQDIETRILAELESCTDEARARSTQRFFKEPISALGIPAPILRAMAKAWQRELKAWCLADIEALCGQLLSYRPLEIRLLGLLVLGGFRKSFDRALFSRLEPRLREDLDNWALVDGCCSEVISPLLQRLPDLTLELPRWLATESLWLRRAALVSLVPFARRGQHLELIYALAEHALSHPEDLMHKALGWLLREAGKADATRLEAFLLRHRAAIPRTSVRYALERFSQADRTRLMRETRRA